MIFAKNLAKILGPVFKWILDSIKNAFEWFDKLFATRQNLDKIRVKEGEGRFKDVRKDLWAQAGGVKDGAWFVDQKSEVVRMAKELAGDAGNWRDFYNEARSKVFDKLVAEYVQDNLGLEAVIPNVKELTLNLDENLDVLESLKTKTNETGDSLDKTFGDHMKGKLKTFQDSIKSIEESMADVVIKGIKGMEDALVDFVMTGKISFKSLANSIIKDMVRIAIQQTITAPLTGWFKGLFSAKGNVLENGRHVTEYAKGGVINSPHFKYMANGGITVAGEAGAEAILPLKRGAAGNLGVISQGGSSTSVVVNVDASGSEVQGSDEQGRVLGKLIAAAINSTLIKEKRPGGLLAA